MRFASLALGVFATLAVSSSSRADEVTYELTAPKAKGTIGEKGKASVTISAKPGWHVNEEAPLTLKLSPDSGLAVDKAKLTRADLAENNKELARFDVAFTPTEAGPKTINGEASFVMCQATTCKPIKEKVALAVEVAAAGAPAKSGKKK